MLHHEPDNADNELPLAVGELADVPRDDDRLVRAPVASPSEQLVHAAFEGVGEFEKPEQRRHHRAALHAGDGLASNAEHLRNVLLSEARPLALRSYRATHRLGQLALSGIGHLRVIHWTWIVAAGLAG